MDTSLYVSLSSQVALENRLNTIANNVANANTVGFRAGQVRFEEVLDGVDQQSPSFVNEGQSYLSTHGGGVTETGSSLDFAVQGEVWFAAESPAGTLVTRDGRFKMATTGELVTLEGHSVLDSGGAPIQLDPAAGPPVVSKDGIIRQNGAVAGSIGLFEYQPTANFQRFGASGIIAESAPQPAVDTVGVGVLQGFVEDSNVDPVAEMSKLIIVHRTFDQVAASIRDTEASKEEAIRTLGSGQ